MKPTSDAVRVIDGLLSGAECDRLCEEAETAGFRRARMQDRGRFNEETFLERPGWARLFGARLGARGIAVASDSVVEVYRYRPGAYLAEHADRPRRLADGVMSEATLIVYLSAGFVGGATRFAASRLELTPGKGDALLFGRSLRHEATTVTAGVKLIARVDVAFA